MTLVLDHRGIWTERPWYEAPDAHEQFAALATWLDEHGHLTLSTLREILDSPHSWQVEYDQMRAAQRAEVTGG